MHSRFVSRVANPTDILLWHKRRGTSTSKPSSGKEINPWANPARSEVEQQAVSIKQLVQQQFEENSQLSLFPGAPMADAVEEYVDRNELNAIKGMSMYL